MSTHPFVRSAPQSSQQPTAIVIAVQTDGCLLKTFQGIIKTRIAFSCMVQPQTDDTVLYTETDQGCFVTQILIRPHEQSASIHYSGALSFTSDSEISINSTKGIKLETPAETELISNRLNIASLSTQFRSLSAMIHVKEAEGRFGRIKWLADWAEQKADKIRQRFKRSDRVVSDTDQQQAGSLIQRVEKTASLRAEHTIIKAKEDVQVDGKRIHMG